MGETSKMMKDMLAKAFAGDVMQDSGGFDTYNNITSKLPEGEISEKWSEKYKDSIDCKNPKGFSQKAHCQGKKKKSETKEATGSSSAGAFVGPMAFQNSDFVKRSFAETPKKVEATEATGSASAGGYLTTAAWAKSTKKKDWRGKSKTQIPGGKFVTVKEKCKKFPYCNQGDIKALKIYENNIVKSIINKISKEYNINENIIKAVIQNELEINGNKLVK
jgi:hypothetical protein